MNSIMKTIKRRICAAFAMTWALAGSLNAQSVNQHFIQTEVARKPVSTENAWTNLSDLEEKHRSVQYFDGLGRPTQIVDVKASVKAKDQISIQAYDAFGRIPREYLPYESTATNGGAFRTNPLGEQDAYFGMMGLIDAVDRDFPFADQITEPSPLNRPIEQGAPGFDWQPAQGHTKKLFYRTNDLSLGIDVVNRWTYNVATDQFVAAGTYAANTLIIVETKDENGQSSIEYKDKTGKVVLRRVQVDASTTVNSPATWANTSFLYDQFGRLRIVIQPEGMKTVLTNGGNINTSSIIANFAFSYQYDEKGRMVAQKAPGAGWKYYVYDPLDQLVLSQDGALRAQNTQFWTFNKYDQLGRLVVTGIFQNTTNQTRDQLQAAIRTGFENGQLKPFEARSSVNFNQLQGYTNQAFPLTTKELHTVTWYDHYDFNLDGIADKVYTFEPEIPANDDFKRTSGLRTGIRTWILNKDADMPDSMLSAMFYDAKGRTLQVVTENHIGGIELATHKYDWNGNPVRKVHRHTDENRNYAVINDFTYDHRGRELTTIQTNELDGVKDVPVMVSSLEYDVLGRVSEKNLHSTNQGNTFTQSIDYTYNIRSWLTGINQINPQCSVTGTAEGPGSEPVNVGGTELSNIFGDDNTEDIFGMKLYHNSGFTALNTTAVAQYTGNISGIEWQTASDCDVKGYGFQYDGMERLKNAWFAVEGSNGVWNQQLNRYSVNDIFYDLNGNIQKLKRKGKTGASAYGLIDDLTYTYTGNSVTKVKDKITSSFASLGIDHFYDANPTTTDYYYDASGNIITDNNKGVSITYNHLSKPIKVQYSNGNRIEFVYDAGGNKLRKKVTAGTTTNEDYINGFFYQNQELQFFTHKDGRVNFVNQSTFEYQYNLTDHLGNVRVSFKPDVSADWVIVQEDHYYPFGMRMGGKSYQSGVENEFRFNGKELVADLNFDSYDYGFRWYMPDLARFVSVDPLADKFTHLTPYQYAENTPIQAVDLDGLESLYVNPKMSFSDNLLANLYSSQAIINEGWEALKRGTPPGQIELAIDIVDYTGQFVKDPKGELTSIINAAMANLENLNSTDPKVAGKAHGNLTFFVVEVVVGAKALSPVSKVKVPAGVTAGGESVENYLILYRGDATASKVIKSYAAKEVGYAKAQEIIENSNLDDLMMAHAQNSRLNSSPLISLTSDPVVAQHFAGPKGTVHVLRIPESRVIKNPYNNFRIPGGISESEYLVPNYIRLSEFVHP